MTPSQLKKATELSNRFKSLSGGEKKRKHTTQDGLAYLDKISKKSVVSPLSEGFSSKIAYLGAPKKQQVQVVERPVFFGKPGERGAKGDRGDSGRDGKDGRHGKDGLTPQKGIHYFTPEEVSAIRDEIQSSIEIPGFTGLEVDAELVKKIIGIMHSLPDKDKLEVSKGIRNAQSFIYKGTKYETSELMHGSGSGGSSGTVYYTPTGIVNASNTVFGVTGRPSSVVSDGVTYFEGFGYSYSTGNITLDIATSQFIKYSL